MGWFSKVVPERKWPDITADLGIRLLQFHETWYAMVRKEAAARGLQLATALSDEAKRFIAIVQIGTVSRAIRLRRLSVMPASTFAIQLNAGLAENIDCLPPAIEMALKHDLIGAHSKCCVASTVKSGLKFPV